MAWIRPTGSVRILHNIPLDNTYDHTWYFVDLTQQETKFTSVNYLKYSINGVPAGHTYQRENRNYIRVEIPCESLHDCNYLMFQNTAYGTKWFYAFITATNYINDNVTELEYEIDVMQTWYFDYELENCFVERHHSEQDLLGQNTVPEPVMETEACVEEEESIYYIPSSPTTEPTSWCIVVVAPFDKQGNAVPGERVTNMYSGLHYNIFIDREDPNTHQVIYTKEQEVADFLNVARVANKADQIVSMFYMYTHFAVDLQNQGSVPNWNYIPRTEPFDEVYTKAKYVMGIQGSPMLHELAGFKNNYANQNEDYYYPKNMKMYTYPYTYITITDYKKSKDYKCEYFSDPADTGFDIEVTGDLSPNPSMAVIPYNYMSNGGNYEDAFISSDFPQCAWNTDYIAGYAIQTAINTVGQLGGMALTGGIMSKLAGGGFLGGAGDISKFGAGRVVGNSIAGLGAAVLRGREVGGKQANTLTMAMNKFGLFVLYKKIRKEQAKIIDNFFTMYGYAQKRVYTPSRHTRQRWTYIQTVGCVINASCPNDAVRKICSIYDKGITYWVSTATMGDYSQSNNPLV